MNENFDVIFQELNRLKIALETCQCGGNASLSEGLVAYYPFNGNANDESGNGNNGIVSGASLTTDRFGNENSAYSFNGSYNNIKVTDSQKLYFETDSFAVSFWIIADTFIGDDDASIRILSKNDYPNTWWVVDIKGGFIQMEMGTSNANIESGNGMFVDFSTGKIAADEWYYVSIVIDRANSKVVYYINGALDSAFPIPDEFVGVLNVEGKFLHIGVNSGWNRFNGKIDNIRIYNRALSASEVQLLYVLKQ